MNWGGVRRGRLLAGIYLAAYVAWVIGLVLVIGSQIAGGGTLAVVIGAVLFLASQGAMFALAFRLRDAMPVGSDRKDRDRLAFTWNRLMVGRELPGAWRVVRN